MKDIEILNYKCTLTPLTPIHIGSGNELSPFDYIIKDNVYYRIDIPELLKKFPLDIKNEFIKMMENKGIITVRKFLRDSFKEEYGYLYSANVSSDVNTIYEDKIGGVNNANEENQLTVFEFIGINKGKYIPGSTIKGALRSAFFMDKFMLPDDTYKLKRNEELDTKPFINGRREKEREKEIINRILGLDVFDAKKDPFKNLKVTDTEINNNFIEIKSILRKGKAKEKLKKLPMGIHEMSKSLYGSNKKIELKFNISIKNFSEDKNCIDFSLEKGLLKDLNNKAEKILKSDKEFFEEIGEANLVSHCETLLKEIKRLNNNQALIRIGKGAGFNSTTLNLVNGNIEEIFTRVTVDDMPIGWAVITCDKI